jgi:arsenite-transporting ATPase
VAAARGGERTLLISTDPAPSVGDALRQPLTSTPASVAGVPRLHAVEVNAKNALERWLRPRRELLEAIVLSGTWLDRDDVADLLRQSLPGIDEIAALLELTRLGRTRDYRLIVVDTAPTGHTLRMLAMPDLLGALAGVFDRMQSKHRTVVEALRGSWAPEPSDRLIDEMVDEAHALTSLLRNRRQTAVSWVTLPEPVTIAETRDGLAELVRMGLHVDRLVINRVTPPPRRACSWCTARRALERGAIASLMADSGGAPAAEAVTVRARPTEPRGAAALARVAAEMRRRPDMPKPMRAASRRTIAAALPVGLRGAPRVCLPDDQVTLLIVGGKGGVGKTTCAAATAVRVASQHRRRQVLLLSSDPAHSIGDVLGVALSDEPRRVPGAPVNLLARELDAAAAFETVKLRYREALDALFARVSGGTLSAAAADREALRDLLQLAPPGLDELMALVEVAESLTTETADRLIVLDTAPTGHALRLLEMPALVHGWVKALMAIVLKYQSVVGIGALGEVLLQMSQGLGRLRARLSDPARTAFIVVTRAAELPAAETRRLLQRLRALDIDVPAIVVNAVGAGTCGHCAATRRQQQRVLSSLRGRRPGRTPSLIVAPAVVPPPHGAGPLEQWQQTWVGLRSSPRRAAISSR